MKNVNDKKDGRMTAKEALSHLVEVAVYGNKEDNRSHIFQAEEVITQAIMAKIKELGWEE
jgi:hypothetical protein